MKSSVENSRPSAEEDFEPSVEAGGPDFHWKFSMKNEKCFHSERLVPADDPRIFPDVIDSSYLFFSSPFSALR